MSRLNSDYVKPHSTDPTGFTAVVAPLVALALVALVAIEIAGATANVIGGVASMVSPHRAPVPQQPVLNDSQPG